MKKASVHCAAIVLAAPLLLQGCGNQHAVDPQGRSGPVEPSTARGLAAGVLAHVDAGRVASVAGTGRTGSVTAYVRLTGPKLLVMVFVSEPMPGVATCGGDGGYTQVSCEKSPDYSEVVERRSGNAQMPAYIGRTQSTERGSVLVEVFGSKSGAMVDLIQSLLADDLIGSKTSVERNAAGEALADFGTVTESATVERGR